MPDAPKTIADVKKQSEGNTETALAEITSSPAPAKNKREEPKAPPEVKAVQPSEIEIDYKAELEKAKASLEREKTTREWERAERQRTQEALRVFQQKMTGNAPASTEVTPPAPIAPPKGGDASEVELTNLVDQRFEALKRSQVGDFIQDLLPELSDDSNEQELIRHIYENDIRPSGFNRKAVEADLKKAYLIANSQRLEAIAFQRAKAKVRQEDAQQKALASSASRGGAGREPPGSAGPQYSEAERKLLGRVNKTKADGD